MDFRGKWSVLSAQTALVFGSMLLLPLAIAAPSPVEAAAAASSPKCGVPGTIGDPYYGADVIKTDLATCRKLCLIRKFSSITYECDVFGYNKKQKSCYIYSTPLRYMQFKENKNSDLVITDARCLPKPQRCPANAPDNLVINGDFEMSDKTAGPWRTTGKSVVTKGGRGGGNALFCYGNCQLATYRGDLCPGVPYALTFDYKFVRIKPGSGFPGSGPKMQVLFGDFGSSGFKRELDSFKEAEWQTFYATSVQNNGEVGLPQIYFNSENHWHFYVDNVKVERLNTASELGPNLVKNGGFEADSSDISPWIYDSIYGKNERHGRVTPGLGGSAHKFRYYGQLDIPPASFFTVGFELGQTNIATELGKTYEISMDFNSVTFPHKQSVATSISLGDAGWSFFGRKNLTDHQAAAIRHFKRQVTITTTGPNILTIQSSDTEASNTTVQGINAVLDNIKISEVL